MTDVILLGTPKEGGSAIFEPILIVAMRDDKFDSKNSPDKLRAGYRRFN